MAFRPPSFSSIAAFEAAARHQSFTDAARELNLSQSAVSHAIKALETRVGSKLFDREGRGVRLTTAGRRLASRVRLSVALLGDAFSTETGQGPERIRITTLFSVADKILMPFLDDLQGQWPGLQLEINCGEALADLGKGEADLAIRFGPGGWTGLHNVHLADEWLFPVASPTYRNGELPRTPEELSACSLISHPESAWRLWLEPIDIDPGMMTSTLAFDDAALVLQAAKRGMGIALARATLVEEELRSGNLVRLFEHRVPAEYSYWCAWSAGSQKARAIERFVQALSRFLRGEAGQADAIG